MEGTDEEKKAKEVVAPKEYTINDVVNFESNDIYSSFGRMALSNVETRPKYGFGKQDRNRQQKVYQNKHLCKAQFIGKTSPGPNFEGTDVFEYNKAPEWVMGRAERNTLDIKQPYDHYGRYDPVSDPIEANNNRKPRASTMRFGTAKRFLPAPGENKQTPGPKYNPNLKPEIPHSDKYSFGFRRDVPGYAVLTPLVSTGAIVGPGSYHRKNPIGPNTSNCKNQPSHKFPEHIRFMDGGSRFIQNETYETQYDFLFI